MQEEVSRHTTRQTSPPGGQHRQVVESRITLYRLFVDENGRGEYFDSFGRALEGTFKHDMDEHCGPTAWTFNRRPLQSVISSFCGYYCCFYCMYRYRGIDLNRIVNCFTKVTAFNQGW